MHRNSAQTRCCIDNWLSERKKCHNYKYAGKTKNFSGENFWARGYAASTVGFELEVIRKYIQEQEHGDQSGRF